MRARAFKDESSSKSNASGIRRAVDRLVDRFTADEGGEPCSTSGYTPRMESGSTKSCPNLSPSLRGCYADPIELALEQHGDRMPTRIPKPGQFETRHHYTNVRDPGAWPINCKVITVCRKKSLRTFILQPDESLGVFGRW